jgi:hypothetical protein
MKTKISKLINRVMLTAAASLVSHSALAINDNALSNSTGLNKTNADILLKNKRKVMKNVLQISKNGDTKLIARHTSHSSHRSHSSSSSYGSSRSRSYSTPSTTSYYTPKTYSSYKLGERTIRRGTYGSDVNELVTMLYNKKYINRPNKLKKKKGYYVYDAAVIDAYQQLLRDAGYAGSEDVDQSHVEALSALEFINPTLALGDRDILNVGVDYGSDVNELVGLLRKAGLNIEDSQIEYNDSFAIYNPYVKERVIEFQSAQKLNPSGVVDEKTIKKLKKVAKKNK